MIRKQKNPKSKRTSISIIVLLALLVLLSFTNVFAATIYKLNNATNLNTGSSWNGGTAPGAGDIAQWTSVSDGTGSTAALGGNVSWGGIQITNVTNWITISAGSTITLGSSGIDMSGSAQSLTINCDIALGADQTWNDASSLTLALIGAVSGAHSLTKSGAGTLTLLGTNTYSGITTISAGILQIGGGGTSGSISNSGAIINNGVLSFNRSDACSYSGNISGTGGINISNGTVTLSGSNTFTSVVNVLGGTLAITNTSGSGTGMNNVTLFDNNYSKLIGTGTLGAKLGNTVYVGIADTLSPGIGGPGTLTINNDLTLTSGTIFMADINGTIAGTSYDQIIDTGVVTLGGSMLQLTLGYTPTIGDAYTIIHGTALVGGTFNGIPDGGLIIAPYGGSSYKFTVSYAGGTGNDVVLTCAGLNTTKIWNNSSGNSKWSNPANWAPPGVPAPTDTVGFSAALTCSLDVNATIRTIKFPPAFTGPFKFLNDTLFISDSADFTGPTNNFFISPGTGAMEFIGPGNHSLNAKQGLQLPGIIQNSNGVTTVRFAPVSAKSLLIKNGTFNLGSFNDTIGTFGGLSGTIDLSSSGLIITGPMADFSQVTVFSDLFSHIEFRGSYSTQTFVPKPGYVFSWVGSSAFGDTVVISTNPLSAKKVGVGSTNGGWRWGNGFTHLIDTVVSLASANNVMDFGNSTVKITSGNIDFSGIGKVKDSSSAKIEFSGVSGLQTLTCPSTTIDTLPGIVHSGPDTLFQMGNLKCRSFLQTAGTFKINGQHDTITMGNFTGTNTTFAAASFCNLDNSFIVTENGDIVLKGHPNDSINLDPANSWNVTALNGHNIIADYAIIGHCTATATSANATNSRDIGGTNTGWMFIAPNTKYWKGSGADSLWSSAYNWLPNGVPQTSDSVVFDNTAIKGCQLNANQTIRTITVMSAFSKTLDFFTGTLSVSGEVNFTGMTGTITAEVGTLEFMGTGPQNFWPPFGKQMPNIYHSGNGTIVQNNHLKCLSFSQVNGQYNINGMMDTITSGDFSISNGHSTSVTGLDGCQIVVQNGNAQFLGTGVGDSLYLKTPSAAWYVKVLSGAKTLSANYVILQNCDASGGVMGIANNSNNVGFSNTNWSFVFSKSWLGAVSSSWKNPNNWSPSGVPTSSDSVVFINNNICVVDTSPTVKAITLTSTFYAPFNFSPNETLTVLQTLDFQNYGNYITAGSGVIALNGMTTQTFYPPYSGAPYKLPKIIMNNPNGANVPYNKLHTSNLTIISGYMTLNSEFNIDSIIVNSPGSLDMSYSYNYDTVVTISGTGNLNMGFADFAISGDMNVGNLNSFIPENAHIKFIGPNNQAFYPNDFGVPTWVEQINGTTVVLNKRLITQNLYLTGGTFNLGAGLQDTIITQLNGGAGALDFGSSTLNLEAYSTDFSSVNFTIGAGTLAFCGPNPQQFTPRAGVLHPDIIQNGYSGTIINTYPLIAKSLTVNQGSFTFSHTGSLRDSVGSLIATTTGTNASIALGQDTLDVSGTVNLSGLTNFMWTSPSALRFIGNGSQTLTTPISYNPLGFWCPPIVHNGIGALSQSGMLKCASFLQTAGTYNLNSAIDTIMNPTNGDFTITNGTASSITGLGNSTIAVKSGNASFSGQGAANLLNLSPPFPWTLSVPTMSKTISAQYAIIGNCKAITYAPLMAQTQFCAMVPGDSNWNMALVMPQIYDTLGTPNLLAASPRAAGDTIDIWYELNDPDNAVDTVKMSFRNGVSGAWTAPVTGTIMGDVGPVASNSMSVHRHVRWSVAGQFGSSFSSDSIQIGLTAQDNFGNVTPKIMPANNVHVNTKGPTFGSNIFILPSVGSIIAGGSVCSITWNWANISFNVQAKNYPLTLQYSLDNGNTFINSAAGNLQNTGSYSWTTPLLTSKNVLLRFTARDTLGNVSYGPLSAAFTIDATPPASNITLPANKSYVNSLANISGNTSDIGSGVKNVFITIKMIAGNYWNGVSAWTPTQTWLSTVLSPSNTWVCNNNAPTGLTNGSTIAIMSLATDSANNAQTIYGADTVTVDTIAPVSTVTYPVNNTSISSLGNISGTASDVGAGVSSLVISFENMTDTTYWNGAGWVKVQAWLPPFGPPIGFSPWNFTPPALTNGKKYLVQSKAIDAAGNMEAPGPGVTFVYSTSAPGLPTIAIVNKQKYINNPLVSLTLSVQNADSMQFHLNAGAWTAWEQFVSSKINFSIAAGGQGAKYIYVEYKDKIGNMTAPVSDSTFYDTIPPKCAINTVGTMNPAIWSHVVSGTSFDTMPGSGVKTVSVRLRNQETGMCWNGAAWVLDSASLIWITATGTTAWNCSLATAAMNSGLYVIQACALDSAGNKGPVVIDSLQLLVPPGTPQISINKTSRFTNSPFVTLTLSAQNVDSMQFRLDAGLWSAWEPYATTKANVAINAGGEGLRKVWVEYKNKVATITTPVSDSIIYDATPPQCMVITHGIFSPSNWLGYFQGMSSDSMSGVKGVMVQVKCGLTGMFWNGTAWGVDSTPTLASLVNGAWKFNLGANVMQPSVYILKAVANDSAGNNSAAMVDSISYAPTIVNNLNLIFTNRGDSAISVSWKVDTTKRFMKNVLYGYKYATFPDTSNVMVLRYGDTSFVLGNITRAGTWYFATGLQDSAGNRSLPRFDSVVIANTPPVLGAIKDTSVFEDRLWQGRLSATDRNADTLRYRVVNLPPGFDVDTISGVMTWTPEYANVGKNLIVGQAIDGHGGVSADSFVMTVMALPPQMAFVGDSVAHEDTLYAAHLQISNLGRGDTATFIKTVVPSWIKIVGDTLSGTPKAVDIGKDTIIMVLSEKAGLNDTLRKIISVLHTDHAPRFTSGKGPDSLYQYTTALWQFVATDIDKGDSLSMTWTTRPKWLTILSNTSKDTNWTFTLGGTPAATDARWEPFVFSVRDTAGASFIVRDSVFVIPLPTTVINAGGRQISYGAVQYAVSGSDFFDTALTFQTSLRSLDDTTAAVVNKTTAGIVNFYPLVDGRYEFKAQAVDKKGLKDPNAPRDTFVISGASRHVFADTTWNMVSVPCTSMPISTVAGTGSMLHWDESGVEQDIYSFYLKPPDITQTFPGMSYWRKSPDTVTIALKPQDVHDTMVSIQLLKGTYGWNQIASPYPYTVKWPVAGTAWKWNNQTGDYDEANGQLEPWTGYWVAVDSSASVRLDDTPVFPSATMAKKLSTFFVNKSNWQVKIKLQTSKGIDAENKVGFNPGARDGYDCLDLAKAPRFRGGRFMFFPHAEWKRPITEFASDIRNTMQHINVFQIAIAPSQGDTGYSQLSFEGTENLSSVYCFLVDPYSVTAIASGKQCAIGPSSSVLYKQLFVTDDKNFIKNSPRVFSLASPYPNPCRPVANINYVLPYNFGNSGQLDLAPYQVKVALYDAMGRQVRELVYHKQLPGMYHMLWDGKNNAGTIVATGAYFCRLEAGRFSATTRLMMIR